MMFLQVGMVMAVTGFPIGLILLVAVHSWCFVWWPVFFTYYIVRGGAYGVPCRARLIMEGDDHKLLSLLLFSRRQWKL